MVKLQVKDEMNQEVSSLPVELVEVGRDVSLEDEIMAMVVTLRNLEDAMPDVIMSTCMGYMARCTEIHLQIIRVEGNHRRLKTFRVTQLAKVMELIEFQFKGASRLIEVRRQEVELSR